MARKSELADLEVALHYETHDALLVSMSGERDEAVWVPKSACEVDYGGNAGILFPCLVTLTLPASMALEKGLL